MIEKWYEKMDAIVGDTMAKLKPNDTLMVMSDHGFEAFRRSIHVNSWLRQNGYLQLKDPSAQAAETFWKMWIGQIPRLMPSVSAGYSLISKAEKRVVL